MSTVWTRDRRERATEAAWAFANALSRWSGKADTFERSFQYVKETNKRGIEDQFLTMLRKTMSTDLDNMTDAFNQVVDAWSRLDEIGKLLDEKLNDDAL